MSELALKKLLLQAVEHDRQLRKLKLERTRNRRRAAELEESYNATLENLMTALDLRDVETFGHSLTVAKYCQALARILGIDGEATLDNIRSGALLHDIGKIAIPDSILKKPSRLSAAEWEKIRLHPALGYGLVKDIKLVKEVGNIVLYHHERYDGRGYPKGLKGEAIPLEARIFALADALDAITSHRPYRKERDFQTARKDIEKNSGTQFDPRVVRAFCSVRLEDWERIRYETTKVLPSFETFSQLYKRP
jgi:putative nucleotidyltransferase with HDIG domain